MQELILSRQQFLQLQDIYEKMEQDYDKVAKQLHFSCIGCPDNCCDSYFLHHTYAEWAYLWVGFSELVLTKQEELKQRSYEYIQQCEVAKNSGEQPQVMCPLNEDGLCRLYKFRLLVCRTHGVPATMTRPDGQTMRFPGCFRCQELVDNKYENSTEAPHVERTPLLQQLVLIEKDFLNNSRHLLPRVRMTIAEMIVNGPPSISRQAANK